MKHIETVQRIIDLIEESLTHTISVKELSTKSGMSVWQFQRVFRSMVGHSVGEYIRRRRLTLAAEKLLKTDERILDIAIEFQFNSQEAFSRPFKAMFGETPAKFRLKNSKVLIEKRIKLTSEMLVHQNAGIELTPEIIELPEQHFIGMDIIIQNHLTPGSTFLETLAPHWTNFIGRMDEIKYRTDDDAVGIAKADSLSLKIEEESLNYMAAVRVSQFSQIPEGMTSYTMPASTFAKFTNTGVGDKTFYTANYIYGTWLPNSDCKRGDGDDYEIFDERYRIGDPTSVSDYYLPIVKIT